MGRVRVDIKDLDMSGLEAVRGRDVVITGKHLCGAATDLALRCCLDSPKPSEAAFRGGAHEGDDRGGGKKSRGGAGESRPAPEEGASDGEAGVPDSFTTRGVAIATCCHHRCDWRAYVNKPFMRRLGFDREDFGLLARMSSWACDGAVAKEGKYSYKGEAEDEGGRRGRGGGSSTSTSPADMRPRAVPAAVAAVEDDGAMPTAEETKAAAAAAVEEVKEVEEDGFEMSKADKAVLGRMVKTLLDTGRLAWLEERGLQGRLVGYVSPSVSPENRLIVVSRRV